MGIKAESSHVLKEIPAEDYQPCFLTWKQGIQKCMYASEDYFEGDHIDNEN